MDVSIFLAKFWGWYLLIFFIILSFKPKRIKQIIDDLKDQKFLIIAAFMAIVVGLLSILFHNIWEPNLKLIVTLLGWISLGLGLSLFSFPKQTTLFLEALNIKLIQTVYTLLFLIGLLLINMAYGIIYY
jgi:hypothetical protein